MSPTLDTYRGCLLGGAAGDALGYPVEFLPAREILRRFGPEGITAYALKDGLARISDDTQMTLFTANGLLFAATRAQGRTPTPEELTRGVYAAYLDWHRTQISDGPLPDRHWAQSHCCWLLQVPQLFAWRAPGNTCLSALEGMVPGSIRQGVNRSRGCGGVMRVAPVGLFAEDADQAATLGAECAALTHGHQLGYLPAAMLARLIHTLSHRESVSLAEAAEEARQAVARLFRDAEHLPAFLERMDAAADLARGDLTDPEAIRRLGAGWVGDEALAIALYCALRYPGDFRRGLIAAVNHSGDSDSTGAITGNILGAALGLSAIPQAYLADLELREVITEMADDLFRGRQGQAVPGDEAWQRKYREIRWK